MTQILDNERIFFSNYQIIKGLKKIKKIDQDVNDYFFLPRDPEKKITIIQVAHRFIKKQEPYDVEPH